MVLWISFLSVLLIDHLQDRDLREAGETVARSCSVNCSSVISAGLLSIRLQIVDALADIGEATTLEILSKTQINLKLIPSADGRAEICELVVVAINLVDINVKGPHRFHLIPTVMHRWPTFR